MDRIGFGTRTETVYRSTARAGLRLGYGYGGLGIPTGAHLHLHHLFPYPLSSTWRSRPRTVNSLVPGACRRSVYGAGVSYGSFLCIFLLGIGSDKAGFFVDWTENTPHSYFSLRSYGVYIAAAAMKRSGANECNGHAVRRLFYFWGKGRSDGCGRLRCTALWPSGTGKGRGLWSSSLNDTVGFGKYSSRGECFFALRDW